MDSPRRGFRRAAVTSWALVGVGMAGVAGASALAYSDTVKPAVADAAIPAPDELGPTPADDLPPAPDVVTTADAPPPPIPATTPPPAAEYTPQPTVEQAPTYTQAPEYAPQYTREQTVEQSPPVTRQAPATQAQASPTTKRRNLTPTTVRAPNYSPHVTISHGS
jgi:protein TonB